MVRESQGSQMKVRESQGNSGFFIESQGKSGKFLTYLPDSCFRNARFSIKKFVPSEIKLNVYLNPC